MDAGADTRLIMVDNRTNRIVCIPPSSNVAMTIEAQCKDEVMMTMDDGSLQVEVHEVLVDTTGSQTVPAKEDREVETFTFSDGSTTKLPPGISLWV